MHTTFSKY